MEKCVASGFVIALTYGKKVDWYANVKTQSSCSLLWKNRQYQLADPEFIDKEIGLTAFPVFARMMLKRFGIECFLRLETQKEE